MLVPRCLIDIVKRYLGDNYLKGDNIKVVINLNKQTAKLEQLRQEKEEVTQKIEAVSSVASDKKTIVCGNCHLRLGHTKKKVCFRTFYR